MEYIAFNDNNVFIDVNFNEHEQVKINERHILYAETLKQLHLPFEKWAYSKTEKQCILIQRNRELELLDSILFEHLDYSKLLNPKQLYLFYVLQLLLGNPLDFNQIGVVRGVKNRLIFPMADFDPEKMEENNFRKNALSHFLAKRMKDKERVSATDEFFILLSEKFKTKLLNALTRYQSETGLIFDKHSIVEKFLDKNRMKQLNAFLQKEMN